MRNDMGWTYDIIGSGKREDIGFFFILLYNYRIGHANHS